VQIEAAEGIGGLATFPSDEEILRAARGLGMSSPRNQGMP
jgi:hypothetical protein